MKKIVLMIILVIMHISAREESTKDSLWRKEAVANINFSNTVYDNWAAGGENSITWNTKLQGKLERDGEATNWKTSGKAGYGQTKQGDKSFRKSLDEFFIETIYAYKLTKFLNPYASATAQSQFTMGFRYNETGPRDTLSNFWDPGYLTQSLGMGYKPIEDLMTRVGFSIKETFSQKYGYADDLETDTEIETFKAEPGLESITEYSIKFKKILLYNTKLSFFVNFKGVDEIDGRWENLLTVQIVKYLNVNFGFEVLYDKDMDDSRQIKQDVAIGLNFNLL
jgi:hypothetical protein